MSKFSERLRFLRNKSSISQQNLADIIGISKSSINMYERGEREPGLDTLEAIADYFNVDMDYLMGRQEIQRKITLTFDASTHEVLVITAYHEQPQNRHTVDKILGIKEKKDAVAKAAASHLTPIAAHNDHAEDPEELERMRQDLEKL